MDYEKLYKDALERARVYHTGGSISDAHITEVIFPELKEPKESEDERIQKSLIKAFGTIGKKDWGGLIVRDILAWLEKQGEKDPCIDCTNDKGCVTCENGNLKEIKSEPKFKVGDWIVSNNDGEVWQIGSIYYVTGRCCYLYNKNRDSICVTKEELNNDYHLWTIQDAKDGDVLVTCQVVFIFKVIRDSWLYCHCSVHNDGSLIAESYDMMTYKYFGEVHPATKEQRDLLFQKIKDAGYEWDAERKELKKIEVTSKESEDEKIRKQLITHFRNTRCVTEKGGGITAKWITWLEKQGERESIWSEEDESWFKELELMVLSFSNDVSYRKEFFDWLKSLKQRIGG